MRKVTTTSHDPPDSPALATLTELGRDAAKPHTAAELDHGLNALRARLAAGPSRRRGLVHGSLLGVAVPLLVLAAVRIAPALRTRAPAAPPSVAVERIEGGALLDGGYLSESGHAGIKLTFNEGTEFSFRPGTRGRLREVTKDGAQLAIENGAASFGVTQNPARHWSIEAGPFLVTVKGTVFDLSWDPTIERFELTLRRGRVVVSGPVAGGSLALRAGEHLIVRLPEAEMVITRDALEDGLPAAVAPADELPTGATAAAVRRPTDKREAGRSAPAIASTPPGPAMGGEARGWPALLAAGRWDRILSDVDRAGVDATLDSAPSEDLFALADAARYRRRIDLARAALLAERRRFPTSSRALDAIFLLGRVAELREDGTSRAIGLYDEYLAQAPSGAYAAEALGRKMILSNDVGGPAKARPIADEYLHRFPAGSYAGTARALTRVP